MSTDVATYEDRFGEERVIHKTRHGLKVKRTNTTPILKLNQTIGKMIGERIREHRKAQGLTLEELAVRIGIASGWPKHRMWEIENATRNEGLRLGTLYAVALGLGVGVDELMPPAEDVAKAANVSYIAVPSLEVG